MVNIAQQILSAGEAGAQVGILAQERERQKAAGEAQQVKKQRIQGYLGQFESGGALGRSQAQEGLVGMGEVDLAGKLGKFDDEQQADRADKIAGSAASVVPAIGTPEEGAAMTWLAGEAKTIGMESGDIQQALQMYDQAQTPEEKSAIAKNMTDLMLVRGEFGQEYLAERARSGKVSQAFEVTDKETGQSVLVQQDARGNLTEVEGFGPKARAGQKITMNPDGTVTFEQGGTPTALTKASKTKLQQEVVSNTAAIDRLDNLAATMDTTFLEIGPKFQAARTSWAEKFEGVPLISAVLGDVSPEDRQQLEDFSTFKAEALGNLNLYIKEITGAAMSQAEAERIMQAVPNPGQGLFDGDSPTQFLAKYNRVLRELKTARARAQYTLKNGNDWDSISLGDMKEILGQEQARFYQEAGWSNDLPQQQKDAVIEQVRDRMKNEYGF